MSKLIDKRESESVARPQADPKHNESSFMISVGLGQNIIFVCPVHKYLLRAQYSLTRVFKEL